MPFHTKAFWAMSLFLVGVLTGSMAQAGGGSILVFSLACLLLSIFLFLIQKKVFAVLILFVAMGYGYYGFFDSYLATDFTAPIGKQIELVGVVKRVSKSDSGWQVDIRIDSSGQPFNDFAKLRNGYEGVFRLYAQPFPELKYGDVLKVAGVLKSIDGKGSGYYKKEGIGALMSFPKKVEVVATGQGSSIFSALYSIRDLIRETFERVLPGDQATLMTGLVIGKSSGFSKEFSEKLKITGTTHLVALSGYNISTVLNWFTVLFGLFLLRKRAMWLSVFAVIAFVLMTGAEASVVRAAIMAVIVVVAKQIERPHSVGNAIVFTALVMILINPRVLAFDIGFQLSFTALVGIVYVKPALDVLFKRDLKRLGFLSWKENLTTTFAAQIAVLPILLMNFGFVTPIGIITNVLLLTFIPPTMALGVIILITNFFSDSLAFVASIPARIFLGYELGVINLFSKFDFGYDVGATSAIFAFIYYSLMIGGILWINKRNGGVTTDKGGAKIKTNDI